MGYIYKIENKINSLVYIGQTVRDVKQRWEEHILYSSNSKIHKALEEFGIENFSFEIIEQCDNNNLNEREIYWIKHFNSLQNGYNSTRGGSGVVINDYEEILKDYLDTKDIHLVASRNNCSIQTVKRALKTYNITLDGIWIEEKKVKQINPQDLKIIRIYNSLSEAAEENGWNISTLSGAAIGKRNSAYGYYWEYVGDNPKNFQEIVPHKRKIVQCDKKTLEPIQTFNSIAEANRYFGKKDNHSSIGNVLSGRSKSAFGFYWKKGD